MKTYFIKEKGITKKVKQSEYIMYQHKAGFQLGKDKDGDEKILPAFSDHDHDLKGWIEIKG
jgi:hypothetical protein